MKTIYRIKPQDKKSIEIVYDVYKELENGSVVGWNVRELYRWGQGFVETEDELPYLESKYAITDPNVGDGAELEDNISIEFEFDDELSEEREHIEECWMNGDPDDEDSRCNAAWLFDYSDWQIEDNSLVIYAPFEITKITYDDNYNVVSEEPVELKPRPPINPNSAWPFGNP